MRPMTMTPGGVQVQSIVGQQQRSFAEKAVATELDWDALSDLVHTDEGKRELNALRSTYLDVKDRLEGLAKVLCWRCCIRLVPQVHIFAAPGVPGTSHTCDGRPWLGAQHCAQHCAEGPHLVLRRMSLPLTGRTGRRRSTPRWWRTSSARMRVRKITKHWGSAGR
jgi:hypothetical protein